MKINIGAGDQRFEGFLTCDHSNLFNPNYVFDLEKDKFPFDTNSIDEVIAHHILEHLGEGYFHTMKEIYRVCKNGAIVDIKVPHFRHDDQYHDPTHRRTITRYGLTLFSQEFNLLDVGASSKLGLQYAVDFKIIDCSYELERRYFKYSRLLEMSEAAREEYAMDKVNVFSEMRIKLQVIKPL